MQFFSVEMSYSRCRQQALKNRMETSIYVIKLRKKNSQLINELQKTKLKLAEVLEENRVLKLQNIDKEDLHSRSPATKKQKRVSFYPEDPEEDRCESQIFG